MVGMEDQQEKKMKHEIKAGLTQVSIMSATKKIVGCQNYDPFLDSHHITTPIIEGTLQRSIVLLGTFHAGKQHFWGRPIIYVHVQRWSCLPVNVTSIYLEALIIHMP